ERPEAHDVCARLAREKLVGSGACEKLLPDLTGLGIAYVRAARRCRCPLERHRERLLVASVRGLELRGLAERSQRFRGHVVIEVNLAERRRGPRAVRDQRLDARPRLERFFPVSGLEVAIAEVDDVAWVSARDAGKALEHFEAFVLLLDALVEVG